MGDLFLRFCNPSDQPSTNQLSHRTQHLIGKVDNHWIKALFSLLYLSLLWSLLGVTLIRQSRSITQFAHVSECMHLSLRNSATVLPSRLIHSQLYIPCICEIHHYMVRNIVAWTKDKLVNRKVAVTSTVITVWHCVKTSISYVTLYNARSWSHIVHSHHRYLVMV